MNWFECDATEKPFMQDLLQHAIRFTQVFMINMAVEVTRFSCDAHSLPLLLTDIYTKKKKGQGGRGFVVRHYLDQSS